MKVKRLAIIALSSVLALSLAVLAFIFISRSMRGERSDYHNERVERFIEENETVNRCDILFLGDSLTDGYDYNIPYPEYFSLNRGIGGDRTADLIDMLDEAVYPVHPELVVLLIGGNDVLSGKQDEYIMENLAYIIDEIKENTGAKILVQSFYPISGDWAHHATTMQRLNFAVEALCEEKGCSFIDMYTPLSDPESGLFRPEYTVEGVHLSDAGREVVVNTLKPVIYDIIRAR